MTLPALGIDLAVKEGAAVLLQVDGATTLATWSNGVKSTTPPNQLIQYFQTALIEPLAKVKLPPGTPVGVDWDPNDGYWGNTRQAVQKSFVAGYLYRYLLSCKLVPVFVPPKYIRQQLGLGVKADKRQVFRTFSELMDKSYPSVSSCYMTMNEHERDSLILAYIVSLQL